MTARSDRSDVHSGVAAPEPIHHRPERFLARPVRAAGLASIALGTALVAGCIRGSDIGDAVSDAFGVPRSVSVKGYVIADAPIADATIAVKCANGFETTGTTDEDGGFGFDFGRDVGSRCVYEASRGTVNGTANAARYYGTADSTAYVGGSTTKRLLLGPLSTIELAVRTKRDPFETFARMTDASVWSTTGGAESGNLAIANVIALTGFDPSRLSGDWKTAYASSMSAEGLSTAAGDPKGELSRGLGLYLRQRGLTLETVTAAALRDGHLMSLPGAPTFPTETMKLAALAQGGDGATDCVQGAALRSRASRDGDENAPRQQGRSQRGCG